ncbi:MAG: WYL domain-containing protein [Cytophagaceae bacterium]|nr:MAG: WYL domain-containing protein [Cytophagaceae bacterium]
MTWTLIQRISESRVCEVHYRASGRAAAESRFDMLPLRLFTQQMAPSLMCYIIKYRRLTSLNLQRLTALNMLDRQAEPPADFDPQTMEYAAFGVYSEVLEFPSKIAPYIRERLWHPFQSLRENTNGTVCLTFSCAASYEVTAWVSFWRHHVTVHSPQSLRAELASFAAWCLNRYATLPA